MSSHRTIVVQDGDDAIVRQYTEEVRKLAEVVIEAIEKNPSYLLSPILRDLIAEQAHKVYHYNLAIGVTLMADSPAGPLEDRIKR